MFVTTERVPMVAAAASVETAATRP
jgi:hypothetical protein